MAILPEFSPLLRRLYNWVMSLAARRDAAFVLAFISFLESSVFPVPPDVMLIPMVLADRRGWWRLATICTLGSVVGALLGYAIGAALFEAIGKPIIDFYHAEASFAQIEDWYGQWGGWAIFAGAVTPLPYKVLTIFSGSVGFLIPLFILVSIVGRGLRFFIVAGLLYLYGEPIRTFIEKRLGLMLAIFLILLVGGFLALSFLK